MWLYFEKPLHMNHIKAACDPDSFNSRSEEAEAAFKNLKIMGDGTVVGIKEECVMEILKTNQDVKNTRFKMAYLPHERRERFKVKSEVDLYTLLAYYVEL